LLRHWKQFLVDFTTALKAKGFKKRGVSGLIRYLVAGTLKTIQSGFSNN